MLRILIFVYLSLNIFYPMLYEIGVERVRVGRVANLCVTCDRTTSRRGGSSTRIILSDSRQSENTINTHKYTIPHIKFK
jgi:hypothetical protein